jgi:hypothetical protein
MAEVQDFVTARVEIYPSEWRLVRRLLSHVGGDETRDVGCLKLISDGTRRRWYATDWNRVICLEGELDSHTYEMLVPPRLIFTAPTIAGSSSSFELQLRDDPAIGFETIAVNGPFGSVEVPRPKISFPDVQDLFTMLHDRPLLAEVDNQLFASAVSTVGVRPESIAEGQGIPPAGMEFVDSELWISLRWPGSGPTVMSFATTGSEPNAVGESQLFSLFDLEGISELFDDPIRIFWCDDQSIFLKFESGPFTVGLRPVQDGFDELRAKTALTIAEVFGPDATRRDSDGDYQLKVTGTPIWGRLLDTAPPQFLVFSTLLTDVQTSPELMTELNDINGARSFVRVIWSGNTVSARAELVASTLDPTELFTAFERVKSAASELTPMLAIAFGGESVDRDSERWASYLNTVISAELSPEAIHNLNGSSGVKHWPFDAPIHVITAWNPYNIPRSQWENDQSNIDLAVELAKVGAKYAPATGTSSDGEHYEPGFVTWSLTRGEAIAIARLFRQEAIFELTSDELRLVHCETDEVDIAPRLSPGTPG